MWTVETVAMTVRLITPPDGDYGEESLPADIISLLSEAADEAVHTAKMLGINSETMKATILHKLELEYEGWAAL